VISGLPLPDARRGWSPWLILALPIVFAAGVAVRLWALPVHDATGDIDQFVLWVHGIALDGLQRAYDQNLSFPAVMAWIWGALAALEPAFRTVTDASDPAIRSLMKIPASLADIGIAAGVVWWFRERPGMAVLAATAVLLWPVTWYVSAWWGQYESIYVLSALLALLAARARRPGLAAGLLALSLMSKPQALPLAVPFAAWFLATQGVRGPLRATAIGAAVIVVLWIPFLAAGGPANYVHNLGVYQNDIFSVLSLHAWNPWWLVQELGANGQFVSDQGVLIGPLTLKLVGYLLAAAVAFVTFFAVLEDPSAERLALALGVVSLGAFVTLTTMHERYAYPAFVFLLLAIGQPGVLTAWAWFAVAFAANLIVTFPPAGWSIPETRLLSIVGAVVITAVAVVTLVTLVRGPRQAPTPSVHL
jgi:hypothetical protein